jgi:hypothetical protein
LEVIRSDVVFAQNWALLLKEADQELIFKADRQDEDLSVQLQAK